MENIRSDRIIMKDSVLKSSHSIDSCKNPSCNIDVKHDARIEKDEYHVSFEFLIYVKDDKGKEIINYSLPYVLIFSLEKFNKYGERKLIRSALEEVQQGAYMDLMLPVFAYFQARIKFSERNLN